MNTRVLSTVPPRNSGRESRGKLERRGEWSRKIEVIRWESSVIRCRRMRQAEENTIPALTMKMRLTMPGK